MPLLRFVLFASGFIACCFVAADYALAPRGAHPSNTQLSQPLQSSLSDWRRAEARKSGHAAHAAIVLPAIAQPLVPTAERLAFERQLSSNTVPTPVVTDIESGALSNARAEISREDVTPQRTAAPARVATVKPKRKLVPRPEIAAADRAPVQRDFGFFGDIFSN